jgi:hypothetical protein
MRRDVYEVAPGKKLWPYHLHHANEEWLVVLEDRSGDRLLGRVPFAARSSAPIRLVIPAC